MKKPLIHVENVSKYFTDGGKSVHALQNITFTVHEGEFFILVGPSGSGKSTLLRIMSGLDTQYTGNITYTQNILPGSTGFVFQNFALIPWLTVSENIELAILSNPNENDRKKRVAQELKRFSLEAFKDAKPKDLSGGMRQRVGLARALANDQKIIFMDEPFSELDSFTATSLHAELLRIWKEHALTIIMVTHIIQEAITLGDRIAVVTARPGKIGHVITNSLDRPRDLRSKKSFALEDQIAHLIKP